MLKKVLQVTKRVLGRCWQEPEEGETHVAIPRKDSDQNSEGCLRCDQFPMHTSESVLQASRANKTTANAP
jgi:hypothetical protein